MTIMAIKKLVPVVMALALAATAATAAAEPAPDSRRLALAKDYIADEQWERAIRELKVVAADAGDANRDEALFWLAHSEHQVGNQAGALETIAQLERLFARSRWVRPARSLRVEIAQRLRRDDVLWVLAAPAAPPVPATPSVLPVPPGPPAPRTPRAPREGTPAPPALPPAAAAPPATPLPPSAGRPRPASAPAATPSVPPPGAPAAVPAAPPAPFAGFSAGRSRLLNVPPPPEGLLPVAPYGFDTDLQIEALVGLLDTHGERVIPLLREIALDNKNPDEARRALFALAQSNRPEARSTVLEAATRGSHVVRLAAIRELGRFGEPAFTSTLAGIARRESDPALRDTAIVTLGRSGARVQLRTLYTQLPTASRFVVLTALVNAKDDDELIRIATNERDPRLRTHARQQLRLLGTAKAIKFLNENP
jgi:hypothetical protein